MEAKESIQIEDEKDRNNNNKCPKAWTPSTRLAAFLLLDTLRTRWGLQVAGWTAAKIEIPMIPITCLDTWFITRSSGPPSASIFPMIAQLSSHMGAWDINSDRPYGFDILTIIRYIYSYISNTIIVRMIEIRWYHHGVFRGLSSG